MQIRRTSLGASRRLLRVFRDAGISTKIAAVVLLTCSVFGVACGSALLGLNEVTQRNDALSRRDVATLAIAANLRASVSASHDALIYGVLAGNFEKYDAAIEDSDGAAAAAVTKLDAIDKTPQTAQQVEQVKKSRAALLVSRNAVRSAVREFRLNDGNVILRDQTQPLADIVLQDVATLVTRVTEDVQAETRRTHKLGEKAKQRVIVLLMFGTAFALIGGSVAARAIAKPLRRAVKVLTAVAEGDFTQTLNIDSKDEVGRMATELDVMVSLLRKTFNSIGGTGCRFRFGGGACG